MYSGDFSKARYRWPRSYVTLFDPGRFHQLVPPSPRCVGGGIGEKGCVQFSHRLPWLCCCRSLFTKTKDNLFPIRLTALTLYKLDRVLKKIRPRLLEHTIAQTFSVQHEKNLFVNNRLTSFFYTSKSFMKSSEGKKSNFMQKIAKTVLMGVALFQRSISGNQPTQPLCPSLNWSPEHRTAVPACGHMYFPLSNSLLASIRNFKLSLTKAAQVNWGPSCLWMC